MIDEIVKKEIDEMSYFDLLKRWRNALVEDPIFQGEMVHIMPKSCTENAVRSATLFILKHQKK